MRSPSWQASSCAITATRKIGIGWFFTASIEAAIEKRIGRAKKTIRQCGWLEVTETRGHMTLGKIDQGQVAVNVGFTWKVS